MNYRLKFLVPALKEWKKLAPAIRIQFKKKLAERMLQPSVPSCRLSGFQNHYKIKLKSSGYRLVYEVCGKEVCIIVIAIGKRNKNLVYNLAKNRVNKDKFRLIELF